MKLERGMDKKGKDKPKEGNEREKRAQKDSEGGRTSSTSGAGCWNEKEKDTRRRAGKE